MELPPKYTRIPPTVILLPKKGRSEILKLTSTIAVFLCISTALVTLYSYFGRRSVDAHFLPYTQPRKCGMDAEVPVIDSSFWIEKRNRVSDILHQLTNGASETGAIYLRARAESAGNEGFDFVQESNFMYLSGIDIPSLGLVYDIANKTATLYLPRRSIRQLAFEGSYPSRNEFEAKYGIDRVSYTDELLSLLQARGFDKIYALSDVQLDGSDIPVDGESLVVAMSKARGSKNAKEIEIIDYATSIAGYAFIDPMVHADPESTPYFLMSTFIRDSVACGARVQAYSPIFAAGEKASVLHFQDLDEESGMSEIGNGKLLLVDAAGAYRGYASDITRTIPIGGWPEFGFEIYSLVWKTNVECIRMVQVGEDYANIYRRSQEIIVEGLIKLGFVARKLTVRDLVDREIGRIFMPHGLGHTVGVDVHDIQEKPWILKENDVLTIEPGIYFSRPVMEDARRNTTTSEFINWKLVDTLLDAEFGGVRIEDIVVVAKEGNRVLSEHIPKHPNLIGSLAGKN